MDFQTVSDEKGKTIGIFVPISEWKKIEKKVKQKDVATELSKQEILEGIKDAFEEIKLIEAGKKKPKSFKKLLNEL